MSINHTYNKGLVSRIYSFQNSTIKKNLIRNWAKHMKRQFNKVYTHMANTHITRYSASLAVRKMQIKTTMQYESESESEVAQSCLTFSNPMDCSPTRLLCPWDFPGKNTGVGCHCLLQRIFPTQGSNPGLLHCRQMLYRLSH